MRAVWKLVCVCVHQLTVEEERQEKAQLLSLVQEMNIMILSINTEKLMCLTALIR